MLDNNIRMICRMHYKNIFQSTFYTGIEKCFGHQDPQTLSSRGIQICLPVWKIDDSDLLTYSTILERITSEVKALS